MAQESPLLDAGDAARRPAGRCRRWTTYPLFVEPIPPHRRGVLAALFLLCTALGGAIGDPLNGRLFDLADSYRPLFLLMALYTAAAFAAVCLVPRGAGESRGH